MEVHPGNSHYPPLSFSGDFNANLAEGEGTLPPLLVCPPPAAKQTPKSPIQIRVKQLQLSDLFSQLNKLTNIFWWTRSPPRIFFIFTGLIVFSMYKVSWFLIVDFTLSLVTQTLCVKRSVLKVLGVLQKSNDIDRAPWKIVWILLVDFGLSLFTRIPYVKHTNCENSRSAAKEASILLLTWNNLSVISSKWQIS